MSNDKLSLTLGSWRLEFRVAIVGCRDSLASLNEADFAALKARLGGEGEWADPWLSQMRLKPGFRREVSTALNKTLGGRPVVSDVLFYDITIYDSPRP